MTICLVNGVFPPDEYGGAENYVLRVAQRLRERGYDAVVLTTSPYEGTSSLSIESDTQEGVPTYRFYPANLSHRSEGTGQSVLKKAIWHQLDTVNPYAKRTVGKFLERIDPAVVHTNNFMGISSSVGAAVAASDARYVHMLHDYSLICPKSNLLRERTLPDDQIGICEDPPTPCQLYATAKRRTIGCPDLVLSPSQHVIDVHRTHGFFESVQAERLFHGVREVVDEPPTDTERAVLYVGKHLRAKGLKTLFEAAEQLPEVTVHLCGTGPFDDESERAAEKQENIEYHGYVSEEKLAELRRTAAAAVVPSRWMENSPLVIYESFAEGLPVVAADVGGLPELVDDERGRLFPPGDTEVLCDTLSELFENEQRLAGMRENAVEWAHDHTMERHIDQLIEYYGL